MNGYYEGCTYGGNTPVNGRIGYPVFHTIDSGGSAMLCANFSRRIDPDEFPGYHAIHNFVETISSRDDCNQPWSNSKDHAASCDGLVVAMVAIEKKRPTIKALVSTGIRHELVALSKNGSNIFGGSC